MNDKGWWQRQTLTDRVLFSALGVALLILLSVITPLLKPTRRADSRETQVVAPIQRTATTTPTTRITKANYERLKEGMKQEEVITILGPVGDVQMESKDTSGSSAIYRWGNAQDGFIICGIGNGKLWSKTQVSLRH